MRRTTEWMLAAGVVLTVATAARPAAAAVFSPETFMLANGMQVVVVPNHRVPVVTHMVWYKVGAADEQAGKGGIAHFLEHLMFKGTRTLASGEFSRIVARNGGRENAFTSHDYTGYFQTVAVDRLPLMMRMEADRMTNLVLTEREVETERLVILEERRARTDNDPAALLAEEVGATLFLNHPYRRPVIGWEREIRGLTNDDILGFYRAHYAPNNAVLVVAGDITAAELRPLAEATYGALPRGLVPERIRPPEPPHRAAKRVELRDARVAQPSWTRWYLAPGYEPAAGSQAYALQILAEVLGGGATSRLYRTLVVEGRLADSAGADYDAENLGPSRFGIFARPRADVAVATLERAIEAEVAKILDTLTADEIERAKTRMQAQAAYARDSLGGGARTLGAALASGRTIDDVESWPDRIGAVTRDQVAAAAREVLAVERSVTAILLPKEGS